MRSPQVAHDHVVPAPHLRLGPVVLEEVVLDALELGEERLRVDGVEQTGLEVEAAVVALVQDQMPSSGGCGATLGAIGVDRLPHTRAQTVTN